MRVGIDIGGTKTDAVALDDAGAVAHRVRLPTGYGPDEVIRGAEDAVRQLRLKTDEPLTAVGIGMPGVVDALTGEVRTVVNLGVSHLPLGPLLAERVGIPVCVENDVNAAAVGTFGMLGLTGSMAYLNLGTGLAAGIVLRGELWRGDFGTAGEIGHVPVEPDGARCNCGQRGCLETIASGSGIGRMWQTADPYPAADLFRRAIAGESDALRVQSTFLRGAASAVRMLVLALDVESVVIGGGLSNLGEPLVAGIRSVITEWEGDSPFLASLAIGNRVLLLPPGSPAAAVGAGLLAAPAAKP